MIETQVEQVTRPVPQGTVPGRVPGRALPVWKDYVSLMRPRLVSLVLVTTMIGFYLGSVSPFDFLRAFWVCVATFLVGGGALALNHFLEREADAKMIRTRNRPVSAGRISPNHALLFSILVSAVGLMLFIGFVNLISSIVSLITFLGYLFLYTPLKKVTWLALFVGAIPGALPPVIGWSAASGSIGLYAVVLFLIVFFWQIPHVMAISWMCRDDYAKAGFPLLSVVVTNKKRVGQNMVLYASILVPVSLLPSVLGFVGPIYGMGALVLGVLFVGANIFSFLNLDERVKYAFYASLIYLPLLYVLMLIG